MAIFFTHFAIRHIKDVNIEERSRKMCILYKQTTKEFVHFDTKTICAFLDKIVAANPKNITLTGGEPLLRSDFLTILGYLRSIYNGKITLMTNGTLITPKNVKEIVSQIDSIDISLDGADEESCAVIRGKGVFEKVVSSIKLLQSHGFSKISISMVLSANNVRYTKQFMELNESLNTTPMLRALSYEGRAKENKDILDNVVTTEFLRQEDKKTNSECRTCCCTAGYNQITIEANGDIFPCNLFVEPEFRLGTMSEIDDLRKLFYTNDGFFVCPCVQKFEPSEFDIHKGETIRFNVTNKGEIEHEFVIDTMEGNAEHKDAMAKMDMEHDDPNSIRLDEGGNGEVIWTFANAGTFEFACLIPGHYESGMHGPIMVGDKMAQADVEYTTGTIKKIDAKAGKVTIIHGPLVSLDMPAMTMVFRADEATIASMSEGQEIKFVADRINGKLTVTQVK